jgi:subtilisin family serine protease
MFRVMHGRSRWRAAARVFVASSVGLAALVLLAGEAGGQEVDRVSPGVRSAAASLGPGGTLLVVVEFQAPPAADAAPPRAAAVEMLRTRASLALRGLDDVAGDAGAAVPDVQIVERFWVVPAATAKVSSAGLERLAAAPGVRRIVSDEPLPVALEPARSTFAPPTFTSDAMRTIGADAVWDAGATGDGVVIAFFDSGVDAANAMVARRWRGLRTSVRASWFDPFHRASAPVDAIGHGTQVAVAAVGALAAGDVLELADGSTLVAASDLDVVTGPAPRAEWIAGRVFDNFGGGVFTRRSVLLQAFQWALDPDGNPGTDDAPDIINASWGILPTSDFDQCTDVLYEAIDAAEAAGIAVVFAAGNGGPSVGSVAFPASRDDAALRNFAVGASSGTTSIAVADFSGRGPSPCGGGIKPEIIAPGTVPEVRADGEGRARLTGFTVQGTSLSTAQASGALALLRQARGGATPETLKRFLIDNAEDVGVAGPDDDAGYGLLDVPAALGDAGALLVAGLLQVAGASADEEGLTVRLRNRGTATWPGGALRVEPVGDDRAGPAPAGAALSPIAPGTTIAARLASPGPASGEGVSVRVTVTDGAGEIALSRLVYAAPPDAFGGFVLTVGDLAAGANDFGRLGRIAAPQGLVWQGTELLPAGGIAVAAGGVVSDGLYVTTLGRSDLKRFGPAAETDWAPQRPFTDVEAAAADVRFDDFEALTAAGLEVTARYEVSESGGVGALGAVFTVRNRGGSTYPDVVVGLLADWDFAGGERVRWAPGIEALITEAGAAAGPIAMLAADTTVSAHVELPLGTPDAGGIYEAGSGVLVDSLTDDVKLDLLRGGSAGLLPGAATATDNAALLGVGPFDLAAGATVSVRFWLLVAPDESVGAARLAELRAEDLPPPPTGGDAFATLPPYPNPLRVGEGLVRFPFTLSEADADAGGDMALEIYDLAGRRLYRDRRPMAPGGAPPEFTWDGRLGGGVDAAGGMYLYVIRLNGRNVSGRVLLVR